MKERPILFSAPMVRAILHDHKTQTRRIMKPQPTTEVRSGCMGHWSIAPDVREFKCPYGEYGETGDRDRLWVRETWAETDLPDGTPVISYRSGACIPIGKKDGKDGQDYLIHDWAMQDTPKPDHWRPSIHMPRWASRILLEIIDVRVQRLQDITEEDAKAEGALAWAANEALQDCKITAKDMDEWLVKYGNGKPGIRNAFAALWESIHGEGSWAENPYVWAIQFRRIEK